MGFSDQVRHKKNNPSTKPEEGTPYVAFYSPTQEPPKQDKFADDYDQTMGSCYNKNQEIEFLAKLIRNTEKICSLAKKHEMKAVHFIPYRVVGENQSGPGTQVVTCFYEMDSSNKTADEFANAVLKETGVRPDFISKNSPAFQYYITDNEDGFRKERTTPCLSTVMAL